MLSKARVAGLKGLGVVALLVCSAGISSVVIADDQVWTGAERSGNKDGTIPEWGGMDKPLAGYSYGKFRGDYWSHKGDKPLFTIDSSNVEKYADKLPPGEIAVMKAIPGYQMDVYPSHRDCGFPANVEANTKTTLGKSKISADGWSLQDAVLPSVPFPQPKSGIEAMWNFLARYQGAAVIWPLGRTYVSPRPGGTEPLDLRYVQSYYMPWAEKSSSSPTQSPLFQGLYYAFVKPAAFEGQALIQRYYWGKDAESFYYFPGQRRVRRLPSYAYDSPLIGIENQYPSDMIFMMIGNPDRFDWKIVGKKEMYVPYNAFGWMRFDSTMKNEDWAGPKFVKSEVRRYELHRVWVIEATVKAGIRHNAPHKFFYLDEDSWLPALAEDYDAQGKIWKMKEGTVIPMWDLGACSNTAGIYVNDLASGRYLVDGVVIGLGKDIINLPTNNGDKTLKDDFYTAESLRAISER